MSTITVPKTRKSHTARILRRIATGSGWVCHICYGPTLDADSGDPLDALAPTIDHVSPTSCGGKSEAINYKIAHRWCNSARGSMSLAKARKTLPELAQKPRHAYKLVTSAAFVSFAKPALVSR